jgi:predicted esterase
LPLLVLLHGDGEAVGPTFDLWESAAARRHVAVLALACPRSLGCSPNSWWQWNHDPAWITEQIAKLAELRPIDKKRLWLVGWSGGASYAGYRTLEIEPSFAAIVIHGGGMPPSTAACSTVRAPIYFLVSDRNPLHSLAQGLRDHYQACGNDVTWTLVHAPNHEDERSALGQYREAIFDWLATKQLAEIVTAMSDASPSPTSDASLTQAPAAPSPALEPLPRSHASCRCILGGVSNNDTGPMALTLGVLAALWIRRRPISSRPCGSARGRDESGSRALR